MRHKIVTVVAAGALGLTGVALAGPALAAVGATGAATAVDDRVSKIKEALAGLVTDKTLTQPQADKVAQALADSKLGGPGGFGPGRGGPGHGGPGHGGPGHGPGKDLAIAAKTLNLTEDQLRTALESGKSLATVAKDQNVSTDTLITALVAAEKTQIAQEVKDGRLTQARADEWLSKLTERVTDRVNHVRPARPEGAREESGTPTPSSTTKTSSYTPAA